MKRLISTLMAVAVLIGCMAFSAAPATAVDLPSANVSATIADHTADTITVTVTLSDNPGIWCALLKLGYNKNVLTPVSITAGSDVWAPADLFEVNISKDPLIMYFEASGLENCTGNGTVVSVVFNVVPSEEDFGITLEYDAQNTIRLTTGVNAEDVALNITADMPADYHIWRQPAVIGSFKPGQNCTVEYICDVCGAKRHEIKLFLIGDINWDGLVNGKDDNLITTYINGDSASIDELKADINGDTQVNGKDGNLMKQIVNGDYDPNI